MRGNKGGSELWHYFEEVTCIETDDCEKSVDKRASKIKHARARLRGQVTPGERGKLGAPFASRFPRVLRDVCIHPLSYFFAQIRNSMQSWDKKMSLRGRISIQLPYKLNSFQTLNTQFELQSIEAENPDANEHLIHMKLTFLVRFHLHVPCSSALQHHDPIVFYTKL